jgi:hypothetical protein
MMLPPSTRVFMLAKLSGRTPGISSGSFFFEQDARSLRFTYQQAGWLRGLVSPGVRGRAPPAQVSNAHVAGPPRLPGQRANASHQSRINPTTGKTAKSEMAG